MMALRADDPSLDRLDPALLAGALRLGVRAGSARRSWRGYGILDPSETVARVFRSTSSATSAEPTSAASAGSTRRVRYQRPRASRLMLPPSMVPSTGRLSQSR